MYVFAYADAIIRPILVVVAMKKQLWNTTQSDTCDI
jgi:hypothetical protein